MPDNVQFLYGKKNSLPGASVAGRLLFTVVADGEGEPEGHIYYDTGDKLVDLYSADIKALKDLIGETSVADQLKALYTGSKTIENKENVLEVKVSTSQEGNILQSGEDGLFVLPGEGVDYTVSMETKGSPNEGAAKTYVLKQGKDGAQQIGEIDIPKDMVVSKADILKVTNYDPETYTPEEYPGVDKDGIYLHLQIANSTTPNLYISLNDLVDVYKGNEEADQVKITVADYTISAELVDGGVSTEKLAANAVDDTKLADNAVTSGKIASSAVTTEKIAEGAVDNTKLASSAVKEENIEDGAVSASKLAENSVTATAIEDGVISEAKLDEALKKKLGSLEWQSFTE